jgi:uncharacterized repeat protein (TIGR01451 family)
MIINFKKAIQLIGIIIIGIFLVATVLGFAHNSSERVRAAGPIPPPAGYPKLVLSTKVVTPTLAYPGASVLEYNIEILNTGAYTAYDVALTDVIPYSTTYNGDAWSSVDPQPGFEDGVISWVDGEVGFDDFVVIKFSVTVMPDFPGNLISNTAVISAPTIAKPVVVMAETRVTDHPVFEIAKMATQALPGPNQPLTYELVVTNVGQEAVDTTITVTDRVPTDTTFLDASPGGSFNAGWVTWNPIVNQKFGETSTYTFSVTVADVPSGTVIENNDYLVVGPEDINAGAPYTTTVIDPIFILSKSIFPDPPGSNREMTYTLTVLNLGSKAVDLDITDSLPPGVVYVRGGNYNGDVVTWDVDSLDTRESAQVTFTVYIADIADVPILNENYSVCSDDGQGVCAQGIPVTSLITGPTFEATAILDPIAKGTGGGTKTVTPTLTIHNQGPGNALDATALLTFGNISISNRDVLTVIPPVGTLTDGPPCNIYKKCWNYVWTGNVAVGDVITITTIEPQSTIGGDEGTPYTATVVVTDILGDYVTEPVTATAVGHITHFANLIPSKSAPTEIGPGQSMTYTIQVFDSAFTTEMDPPPILTDTVPANVILDEESISDEGTWVIIDGRTVVSWTLPAMGPGDSLNRSFSVDVPDLVSGTLIVNDDYRTTWYESEATATLTNMGEPVTTTVHEVGLIDSYKTVSPTWALPGTGTVLTYVVHVVNSGPNELSGVELTDIFPWESTTYQRDAVASAGSLISDIVSLDWTGDLAPYSEELITFTAAVDDFFEGVVTNTATISHNSLLQDKIITAVAYITDKPVLRISKIATPDPVMAYGTLLYQIQVTNLGQMATMLVVTDTIPVNTEYIDDSASSGGQLVDGMIMWENYPVVLNHGETQKLTFQVIVLGRDEIINDDYAVRCDEGVYAYGEPVVTHVRYLTRNILLPLIYRE